MPAHGGVGVGGGHGKGDGHIGHILVLGGKALAKGIQPPEQLCPLRQQGHGVRVAYQYNLRVRVQRPQLGHHLRHVHGGVLIRLLADGVRTAAQQQLGGGLFFFPCQPQAGKVAVQPLQVLKAGLAQHAADHGGYQLLALPVGGVAQCHKGGHQRIVGADLHADDVRALEVVQHLGVDVVGARLLVHLGHCAGVQHIRKVAGGQPGQAKVDGVLAVQPKAFAHQRNIALLRVALEVWGRVYADGGFGVLEIRQTHAGNDAVAQRHIGALGIGGLPGRGFLSGLSGLLGGGFRVRGSFFCGLHLRGGGGLLRRQGVGLLGKGRHSQQHQRSGAAQPCGKTGMVHG